MAALSPYSCRRAEGCMWKIGDSMHTSRVHRKLCNVRICKIMQRLLSRCHCRKGAVQACLALRSNCLGICCLSSNSLRVCLHLQTQVVISVSLQAET